MPRIPDIRSMPLPIVDTIPRPSTDLIPVPPVVNSIAPPIVDIPSFEPPSYTPPQINPQPELSAPNAPQYGPPTSQPEQEPTRESSPPTPQTPVAPERAYIEVPLVGEVPVPRSSEIVLAGTTAMAATAAALLGKSIVEWLVKKLKPLVKKIYLKIKERLGKQFTDYELQQFFNFEERLPEQKQVAKRLKADSKAEKSKQLEEHLQRQHRRKR